MLDSKVRPFVDLPLSLLAVKIHSLGIRANTLTCAGFILALCSFAALASQSYVLAFVFICLSRIMDGLDGLVARLSAPTDLGGYLDIVSDFIFYSGAIFFFALGRPDESLMAAFLLFSFMGAGSSFLAYAIVAEKHNVKDKKKSFFYLGGLTEGTETIIMLLMLCVFPNAFGWVALIFGFMCWMTTYGRVRQAISDYYGK